MKKYIILCLTSFFIFSCGGNLSDGITNLSHGYQLVRESGTNVFINGPHIIPCKVLSYDYDNFFLITVQKPLLDGECIVSNHRANSSNDLNFWIIKFDNQEIFGPYTHDDFLNKRQQLRVSNNLKLKY